ncbi:hypothetical protein GALMADRAFT_270594 [Galerina marginata CBS 339.88]|uniref:HAM1-like N-terminal domain-containing protein n=1 Tax=Galerina marginata (strain CBS 339.88) TaxID=685588 RepID=A0A067SY61_GALM3|nr:hypothetical protein GALMADRAFT_270594 [Galerina marginata CBS 339.88]
MGFSLPCLGKRPKDSEREPLLPKNRRSHGQQPSATSSELVEGLDTPTIDKIVDVLAALNTGKLPSQDQTSHFLRLLLKSELLNDDNGRAVSGTGPTSEQGRQVIADLRRLVQVALRFGMEKNADNTLQELYFQLVQTDTPPISVDVSVDAPTAYKAGHAALDATKSGVSELKQETPTKGEIAFDAETLIDALRTLFLTSITSPAFRLILIDLVFVLRDQVARTAADVGHVAHGVELAAKDVEEKARNADDIIVSRDGEPELDSSVTVDDVKEKGKETFNKIKTTAGDVKKEWEGVGQDLTDKTKETILGRVQEALSRIQEHPASRSAMRSIVILVRKYAEVITSASETATGILEDAIGQTRVTFNEAERTYPPQPYGQGSKDQKLFIDISSDAVLQDLKIMLQRMAKGHSLDGMIKAFSRVVKDIEEVPLIVGDELHTTIAKNMAQSSADPTSPHPPSPETTSNVLNENEESKSKKKKKKKSKKKHSLHIDNQPSSPTAISPSESQNSLIESPTVIESPVFKEEERTIADGSNPVQIYFSHLGTYLDKSLEEDSDWVTSEEGWKTLEDLFDDGVELINVVGESVIEVEEELVDVKEDQTVDPRDQIRRRFKGDLKSLMNEVDAYAASLESDKTTVDLVHALDALGDDLSGLLSQSSNGQSLIQNISGMRGWSSWIGWAIPRLLRLIPTTTIPVPFIEVKTPTMEGALRALFIQGLGRGTTDPLGASLVPDEVVLKESTEMKIDLAHRNSALSPPTGHVLPSVPGLNLTEEQPGVHTTSRLRMHLDGVRARVEGMGYYFKYKGGIVDYEDEGILSVNVGMNGVHEGLGLDVEVEVENDFLALENPSRYNAIAAATADVVATEVPLPEIIVQSEEGQVLQHTVVVDDGLGTQKSVDVDLDEPANMGVQVAVGQLGSAARHERDAGVVATTRNNVAAEPLFRIVDVSVAMRGLQFRIDQSRHWILNKLFVQPLAGPVVARLVKQGLEEKARGALEVLARGLGEIARDAQRRGAARRAQAVIGYGKMGTGKGKGKGKEKQKETEPKQRDRANLRRVVLEKTAVTQKDDLTEVLGDWWSAILHTGPAVFGRAASDENVEGGDVDANTDSYVEVQTRKSFDASPKGLVFTSTTTTTTNLKTAPTTVVEEQPTGTDVMDSRGKADLTMEDAHGSSEPRRDPLDEEEVVVAIGSGKPQLFPGKAGAPVDSEGPGLVQGVKENVVKAMDNGKDIVERVGERWDERMQKERKKETWKSTVFDF